MGGGFSPGKNKTGFLPPKTREGELIGKAGLSSDLESATRLHEAGIASNRRSERCVNTFPGLVHTARHITKVGCTRSRCANRKEAAVQGMAHDWGEVVTR